MVLREPPMSLHDERKRIDIIDGEIIRLLNERALCAQAAAREKAKLGLPVYDPTREQVVVDRILASNQGPLRGDTMALLYREVISACRALEHELRVAYLGPEGSFTHLACHEHFGHAITTIPAATIPDVFIEVEKDAADYGLVPIENSTEGVESHTLDMFVNSTVQMCAETNLEITQNLLGKCALAEVRTVYSHPNALGQCQSWLRTHLPLATTVPVSSTSRGAELASREDAASAIGNLLAGRLYGLNVLAARIEDNPNNRTRFLVIGKVQNPPTGKDKTSLVFSLVHRPGALFDALENLKKHEINMSMIQSRPNRLQPWEYFFFVDCFGHQQEAKVMAALDGLRPHCHLLRVLGSYPEGE